MGEWKKTVQVKSITFCRIHLVVPAMLSDEVGLQSSFEESQRLSCMNGSVPHLAVSQVNVGN